MGRSMPDRRRRVSGPAVMITISQLAKIAQSASKARLLCFLQPLNDAMKEFSIDTPLRQAAFLAQCCHESGGFYYVRELASGKAYENRIDLGNIHPGDGPRFKGRGLLQITGRENYEFCGKALGLDLVENPDLLEEHPYSSRSAGWFWSEFKNLNLLADKGEFNLITKRINGGYNGLAERALYYDRAKHALGVEA